MQWQNTHMAQERQGTVHKVRGLGTIYRRVVEEPDGTLRELPHWHIQFSHNGKQYRESTHTDSYNKAVNTLKKRHGEVESGKYLGVAVEKLKVSALLDDVLDDYETRHPDSVDGFAKPIITRLKEWFDGTRVVACHPPVIRAYIKDRMKEEPAPATLNRELTLLRRAFRLGVDNSKITLAHVPKFKDLFLKENNARQGFFEYGDYQKLRDALPADEQAVFVAGYWTLMRYTALVNFEWDWVNLDANTIRVPPGVIKNDDPVTISTGGPGTELHDLLAQRLALRQQICPACPWVFFRSENRGTRGKSTRQIGKQVLCIRHVLDAAKKDLGMTDRLFHDLRRTGARDLRKAGVSEGVIMRQGGWRTRSVFERYNIKDESDMHDAAAKRNQLVQKAQGEGK